MQGIFFTLSRCKNSSYRSFHRHAAAYTDVVDFYLAERFVCLAAWAASVFQVAEVPLVKAVLVDLAYTVAIALVALEWNEWHDFGFFGAVCCGAR